MNRPRFLAAALLVGAACLGGCSRSARPANGLTPVTLRTDWYAQPEHGGFYQAVETGLYRKAGLDVTIVQGQPFVGPPQVVAAGHADFGILRSDDIIVAVSNGIPLVMLGGFMQKDPQAIMYHEGQSVRTFADLNGQNILAVPGSNFLRILADRGISLRVTPTDFGIGRFLADPKLLTQCFVTNEPYYARQHGAQVGVLLLSDFGFSPYRVWFTTRKFLQAHPDVVRDFNQASLQGWNDYVNGDRSKADARIASLNPRMTPDFVTYCLGAMKQYHLITGDPAAGDAPGKISRERIAEQIRQLTAIGVLGHPVKVEDVLP